MILNTLTPYEVSKYKDDERNYTEPYKAVVPGYLPVRFDDEQDARSFFNMHRGTCLLSYNKKDIYKVIAYKFRG